jgi:L-ascorbate metabolism protein UlaG (beta-lactamase superfamily)
VELDTGAGAPVYVTYYGHCAFMWESPEGVRVLIDPYQNRHDYYWFLHRFPSVDCDLALVSHAHFDHNAVGELSDTASVLRMPGKCQYRDISVRGVWDLHAGSAGRRGMLNVMYIVEIAGIRFLHTGDNRAQIPAEVCDQVGAVDVLMITADDSSHILVYDEVDSMVDLINPRVVIPTHYLAPGLTTEESTLLPPDGWLATQKQVRRMGTHTVGIAPRDLPVSREVWVMDVAPESLSAPATER